ncbi:MAG: hypothetical protein AAF468_04450 [Pseudomonadota bacterium]
MALRWIIGQFQERRLAQSELVLFWITAAAILAFAWLKGPATSLDSGTFQGWANGLTNQNFNYLKFFSNNDFFTPVYTYTVIISQIAIFKALFGTFWAHAFLVCNMVATLATLILARKICRDAELHPIALCLLWSLFLISVDYLTWPKFILSDPLFAFLVLWSTWLTVFRTGHAGTRRTGLFLVSLVLLFLTRPAGAPVIFVLAPLFFAPSLLDRLLHSRLLLVVLLLLSLAIFLGFANVAHMQIAGRLQAPSLDYFMDFFKQGMIIHDRHETWIVYSGTITGAFEILCWRLIYFFIPFVMAFSSFHIAMKLLFFVPVYGLIAVGELRYRTKTISHSVARLRGVLLCLIIGIATYHSLLLIDYDWRYRYPLIAPMLLLAALHFSDLTKSRKNVV